MMYIVAQRACRTKTVETNDKCKNYALSGLFVTLFQASLLFIGIGTDSVQ